MKVRISHRGEGTVRSRSLAIVIIAMVVGGAFCVAVYQPITREQRRARAERIASYSQHNWVVAGKDLAWRDGVLCTRVTVWPVERLRGQSERADMSDFRISVMVAPDAPDADSTAKLVLGEAVRLSYTPAKVRGHLYDYTYGEEGMRLTLLPTK